VELRMDSTRDRAAALEAIRLISVETQDDRSCVKDVLNVGNQQASSNPVAFNNRNIIILLTDVAQGDEVGADCKFVTSSGFPIVLQPIVPPPLFVIYVGSNFAQNQSIGIISGEYHSRPTYDERDVD